LKVFPQVTGRTVWDEGLWETWNGLLRF